MNIRNASIPSIITIISYHKYITIADVLNGIHMVIAPSKPENQERLKAGEALKRIDPLAGRYIFQGLVYSGDDDDTYVLKLGWELH
jgi:hypothetical protein